MNPSTPSESAQQVELSKAITSHHTVWIRLPAGAVPVRYATQAGELICFGDGLLTGLGEDDLIEAAVHEIACGPPVETFRAAVRVVPSGELSLSVVAAVQGNAPDPLPGRNPYAVLQETQRFLGLRPLYVA